MNRPTTLAAAALIVLCLAPVEAPAKGRTVPVKRSKAEQARIAEGHKLFDTLGCANCHSIDNKGGCLAPPLDCVSLRRSDEYLMLRLGQGEEDNFIKRIGHPELMEHPRFPKEQLSAVIAYLRTLPCKVKPQAKPQPAKTTH